MSDPTALPNFPPPPQEHPLRGRVLDALQDLQLGPDLDAQGDVAFTAQGQKLFVRVLQGGQVDIMRTFGQWQIADTVPGDLITRLNACNDITLGMNLVKSGIAAGNLVLTVEQIVARREGPKAKLQISVGLLIQAVQVWHRNVLAKSGREAALAAGEDLPEGSAQVAPWLSQAVGRPGTGTDDE